MKLVEEEVAFFYHVGSAMQQWAYLERKLQSLACACVSPIDRPSIATAFWGIENFRSKLQFTTALVLGKLGKTIQIEEDWAVLDARIRSASSKRNAIAHGVTNLVADEVPGRRWGLIPWILPSEPDPKRKPRMPSSKARKAKQPSYAICMTNLELARGEFHAVMTALVNFEEALRGRPAPFARALEQSPDPTAPEVLVERIRAKFPPREKPLRK